MSWVSGDGLLAGFKTWHGFCSDGTWRLKDMMPGLRKACYKGMLSDFYLRQYNEMTEIIINKLVASCQSNLPSPPLHSSPACNSFVLSFTRSRQEAVVLRWAPFLNTPRIQQRFSSAYCFTIRGSAWRGSGPPGRGHCTRSFHTTCACDITSWCHQTKEQSVPRCWRLSLCLANVLSVSSLSPEVSNKFLTFILSDNVGFVDWNKNSI